MYQQQNQPFLSDEDLAYTVLCDLKRVVREYATAATEASCPDIRELFTKLTNSTLTMQGQLFQAMQQANMYNTASPALRQELDKQMKQYQQTKQKTQQFLQQKTGGQMSQSMYTPSVHQSQSNQFQQPNYQ
ncbi:spore coat protein [Paenibacillus harenae]|uniref:Spore coat protein CotF n=1 Tax=Paenibacillus harenae TaxID=306543 RepID=A0ABT9TUE5_PAEHA|nr:spore coat protein [Paenibacillus harenae]MDQ0061156.1 spore coat protein CotF [Paenibacillus harenae]MDQ0110971.1 spore coat protein CotF [Paenibacillus harenae]